MLKPQDLRIGNFILWNPNLVASTTLPPSLVEVVSIRQDRIGSINPKVEQRVEPFEDDRLETDAPERPLGEFEPIALTAELIESLTHAQREKIKALLQPLNNVWWFGPEGAKRKVEYLHQLQNLYVDFIGEELQIAW